MDPRIAPVPRAFAWQTMHFQAACAKRTNLLSRQSYILIFLQPAVAFFLRRHSPLLGRVFNQARAAGINASARTRRIYMPRCVFFLI